MQRPSIPPQIHAKAQHLAISLERAMAATDCHHTRCQIKRLHRKVKYIIDDCRRSTDG